jgi:hypothetical protein
MESDLDRVLVIEVAAEIPVRRTVRSFLDVEMSEYWASRSASRPAPDPANWLL